jgi:hypothetical protein
MKAKYCDKLESRDYIKILELGLTKQRVRAREVTILMTYRARRNILSGEL